MTNKKRILLVSRDVTLLQTRKLMLGAYFDVSVAGRALEARKLLAEKPFDLMILCYTLSDDDCESIMNLALEHCPQAKILMLTVRGCAAKTAMVHSQLPGEDGPFRLVMRSAEILGVPFLGNGRLVRASRHPLTSPSSGAR